MIIHSAKTAVIFACQVIACAAYFASVIALIFLAYMVL